MLRGGCLWWLVLAISAVSTAGEVTLKIGPPSVTEPGIVVFELATATAIGSIVTPTALQWTIKYPLGTVATIALEAGPAAVAGEKTLECNPGEGWITCVLYGMNVFPIFDGVVAAIQVTLSPGPLSEAPADPPPLVLTGVMAADAEGNAVPVAVP